MSTPNIDNCPRCGRIYVKNQYGVCISCFKEIEQEYDRCSKYLRENRGCTLQELSEATEVSIKQITKFIREGRIAISTAPNMSYPCEVCGDPIRESNMCSNCRERLNRDIGHLKEEQNRVKTKDPKPYTSTYQSHKDR